MAETLLLAGFVPVFALQQAPASLSGTVLDSSGAAIASAALHVHGRHLERDLHTDATGQFSLSLPPGSYMFRAEAPGFEPRRQSLTISTEQPATITLRLRVAHLETGIEVSSDEDDTSASGAGTLTLSGDTLAALSDDDATFAAQVQAMAGSSDLPTILVNGFSATRIPPKSEIQSIRINANPYSAMYDAPGRGRIEIVTRTGQQAWHGSAFLQGTANALNAPNPFLRSSVQPSYYQIWGRGSVGGSLGRRTTLFADVDDNQLQNNAIVNAISLNPSKVGTLLNQSSPAPVFRQSYSAAMTRQWSPRNQMTARLDWIGENQTNAGTGSQTLAPAGYNANTGIWTLQIRDVQTLGTQWVLDEGAQLIRSRLRQDPNSTAPTLLVEGVAMGGGSPLGQLRDHSDTWEFQQLTTWSHGHHLARAGMRIRDAREANSSTANFNGEYVFPTLASYETAISTGSGASQYAVTTGLASATVLTLDAAFFAEEEWSLRPNLTLSAGLRLETQTAIPDHLDAAPRLGVNWSWMHGARKTPLLSLRAGAGLFYDRFPVANLLTAVRQNGSTQISYLVDDPVYGSPDLTSFVSQPTRWQIEPTLHTPTDLGFTLTADHRFPIGRVAANLFLIHSTHQFLARNLNAPEPDTGVRPLGNTSNLYQFSSDGTGTAVEFALSGQLKPAKSLTLISYLAATRTRSDAFGLTSFPSNQYNLKQDYGVPAISTSQFSQYAVWDLPRGVLLQPYFTWRHGVPYNVTTGTDLNGDQQYNDRPAFATASSATTVATRFGLLDTTPTSTERLVPINYGHSPDFYELALTAGKSFHLGPEPGGKAGQPRPWLLTFKATSENLTNHTNAAPPIGVLLSSSFGKSINLQPNQLGLTAANRVVYFSSQLQF